MRADVRASLKLGHRVPTPRKVPGRSVFRVFIEVPGRLTVAGRVVDCRVIDLSVTGAGVVVETDAPTPGTPVGLALELQDHHLDLSGVVVRSAGRHAGIAYWNEPSGLARLLAAAQRPDLVRGVRSGYERRARVSWSFLPSN